MSCCIKEEGTESGFFFRKKIGNCFPSLPTSRPWNFNVSAFDLALFFYMETFSLGKKKKKRFLSLLPAIKCGNKAATHLFFFFFLIVSWKWKLSWWSKREREESKSRKQNFSKMRTPRKKCVAASKINNNFSKKKSKYTKWFGFVWNLWHSVYLKCCQIFTETFLLWFIILLGFFFFFSTWPCVAGLIPDISLCAPLLLLTIFLFCATTFGCSKPEKIKSPCSRSLVNVPCEILRFSWVNSKSYPFTSRKMDF